MDFGEKIFLILTLLTELRSLGSLLRIKKDELEKFGSRIDGSIKKIKSLASNLKENYALDLTKKESFF